MKIILILAAILPSFAFSWDVRMVETKNDTYMLVSEHEIPYYKIRFEAWDVDRCIIRDIYGQFANIPVSDNLIRDEFTCQVERWEANDCKMVMRINGKFASWVSIPCVH